jgi:DNA (cytosine-5)-methyltransferase 1
MGQNKKYSDRAQRTDDLFFEYVRFVRAIQPRVFVAENVAGLVKGAAKGYFLDILRELKACGYRVEARLLDAQWLGVPQQRERLIFVGVREDLGRNPAFPTPLSYRYSMREAFEGLQAPVEPETDISRYAIGDAYDWLTPGKWSDRFMSLGYRSLDEPSFAITARAASPSTAGIVHPTEKRKFSVGELRRLSSFPDDFVLSGSYEQQCERLGRAVPPLMAAAIATAIRDQVLIPAITAT